MRLVTEDSYERDGEERTDFLRFVDFDDPASNRWYAVNQVTVKGTRQPRRPHIVLYLNGIPLVVIELKNPVDAAADVWKAWKQIQTYLEEIPQAFESSLACVIADGQETRMGSITAPRERFMKWRMPDDEQDRPEHMERLKLQRRRFCRPDYLLA